MPRGARYWLPAERYIWPNAYTRPLQALADAFQVRARWAPTTVTTHASRCRVAAWKACPGRLLGMRTSGRASRAAAKHARLAPRVAWRTAQHLARERDWVCVPACVCCHHAEAEGNTRRIALAL